MFEEGFAPDKDSKRSLSVKFSLIILAISVLIGLLIIFVGYQIYYQQMLERYEVQGEVLVEQASKYVNWDKIDDYLESGEEDAEYQEALKTLRMLCNGADAEYLYVLIPEGTGAVFVFDSDESDGHYSLGEWDEYADFVNYREQLDAGERIGPFISNDDVFGQLLSFYIPFTDSNEEFAGYLGVDYSVDHIMEQQWEFTQRLTLAALLISLAMTALFYFALRRMVLRPINKIASAANNFIINEEEEGETSNSITTLRIQTHDELQDLSEALKSMEQKIQRYILHLEIANEKAASDLATQLLNRESFTQRVSALLAQDKPGETRIFMMIDIDTFKSVNDIWGHAIGDDVIVACANIIKSHFRGEDLVARVGGDEFAVYCDHFGSLEDIETRAESICRSVREFHVVDGLKVTVSVGVAICNRQINDYREFYMAADKALYDAKAAGRDRFVIRHVEDEES